MAASRVEPFDGIEHIRTRFFPLYQRCSCIRLLYRACNPVTGKSHTHIGGSNGNNGPTVLVMRVMMPVYGRFFNDSGSERQQCLH